MKRAGQSLKRAAPGASPQSRSQSPQIQNQTDIQYSWNRLSDANMNPTFPYATGAVDNADYNGASLRDSTATPTNAGELIRRNANTQLSVPALNAWDDAQVAPWEEYDDDDQLDQRALEAQREATAKKRQIPPFVQKLSRYVEGSPIAPMLMLYSFLDDPQNSELIRWTDDGLSFVVLDEDEFAKKLIPHLFKHNNYASFVRQLNMYGFHKQVGLSDNSMRSSENKKKAPSRYSNPYFRRGRPNLLWLIIKPKNTPSHKKSQDSKVDIDLDGNEEPWQQSNPVEKRSDQSKETVSMSRAELEKMRQEIVGLKKQNQLIMSYIGTMKKRTQDSEEQLQQMRRHESSINAIMTFLATFYSRSVDGQTGANLANMFPGSISGGNQTANVINVTDMADMADNLNMNLGANTPFTRARRRLLLPAPDTEMQGYGRRVVEQPASRPPTYQPAQVVNIESPSPRVDVETPKSAPDDLLSILTAANTASPGTPTGSNFDFNAALQHIQTADGNTPLTDQQRNDMIQRMSQQVYSTAATTSAPIAATSGPVASTSDPTASASGPVASTSGASPLNPTAQFPLDSLPQMFPDSADYLQKLQEEHNKEVQRMADRLSPLSPNGLVPGLYDSNVPAPAEFDLDLDDWLADPLPDSYFPPNAAETYGQGSQSNLTPGLIVPDMVSAGEPIFGNQSTAEADGGLPSLGSPEAKSVTLNSVDNGDANGGATQTPSRKRQRRD
jgi:heat shock transcription factor, other eukaryote